MGIQQKRERIHENHECKTVERKKCIQYSNGLIYRNKNLGLFVNENFEILLMKELRIYRSYIPLKN